MRKLLAALRRRAADWRVAMCKMHQIQFSAPWRDRNFRCG